jgi:hypothetical protein
MERVLKDFLLIAFANRHFHHLTVRLHVHASIHRVKWPRICRNLGLLLSLLQGCHAGSAFFCVHAATDRLEYLV